MPAGTDPYAGREPAHVKHHFLRHYLGRLVHKTASAFDEVVYVDGFAGPWQSRSERYEDTSFGIALGELTKAKESWRKLKGRRVQMAAHLVEKDSAAYDRLSELQTMYPEVQITPYHGEFVPLANSLATAIPRAAFAFFFIDPKGWLIDMEALRPLISRRHSEVVFNFMFDFINRFATMPDPALAAGLDRLMPVGDWREKLREIADDPTILNKPKARERALIDAFKATVSAIGNYEFPADVPVFRATKDRTLYFLVYGTRSPTGIEVFRDCQISTLQEQSAVRGKAKVAAGVATSGQLELMDSLHEMGPDPVAPDRSAERQAAAGSLLAIAQASPNGVRWGVVWPVILSRHMVKRSELNGIANLLRREGKIRFPAWPSEAKRKPEDEYVLFSA